MLRQRFVLAAVCLLCVATSFAGDESCTQGTVPGSPWHNFWVQFHRNNNWPEPFVCPDRACVSNMLDAQTAKGWQMQNMLGDPHFEPDNMHLTPTGMMKLRYILTQIPMQYRTVFVERGNTDDVTSRRLGAAQTAAAEITRGPMPDVVVSNLPLVSTPAEQVYGTNQWMSSYLQSIPKPVSKAFQNTDASSGSSGS
ncbi:MAG TPA: hypothetical protein VGJ15_10655 [Pirellulales bacterium]|jgi:hypothetical protein